jgi:protein-S-isoprenylcysteine O-methyltransferase Ste14
MDISDRNTSLITDGLFARVRHPIYAFSIALMIATAIVLPTLPMVVVALLHLVLMNVKARSEEAHHARMHGDAYLRYVERTGRFVPRAATRDS